MKQWFLFAIFSGLLLAQAADPLEIRVTVLQVDSDGTASLPVEGVEVSLIEFIHDGPNVNRSPVATAYTDSRGAYRFHPDHLADYWVEVKKEGYMVEPQYGTAVKLDRTHSTGQSTFALVRRGSTVSGRVIDEDGQPVPGLQVAVQSAGPARAGSGGDGRAVTEADGTFTSTDLLPGPHVVRITSRTGALERIVPHFSADDLKTVDRDVETSYWPGGTASPVASIPLSPGGSASIGTIRIHKVPLYRAHVSVPHAECAAGEKWIVRAAYSGEASLERSGTIPCTSDFLVTSLRAGTYSFMLEKDAPAPAKWAVASADITSKNIEVVLTLEPESQIVGRFVAADGATLPPLDKLKVSALGHASGPFPVSANAEGNFVLTNLKFPDHKVRIDGLTKGYYVKEFRLNGASSSGETVLLSPGVNQLQIVIDDKPGVISGTVTDGDKPAANAEVRLYPKDLAPAGLPVTVSGGSVRAGNDGRFQIKGLTPGEYRIVAWQPPTGPRPGGFGDILSKLAAHTQSIAVERGGTSNVDLRLADPSQ